MLGACFRTETHGWAQDQWSHLFSNFGVSDIWERGAGNSDRQIYQPTIKVELASDLPTEPALVVLAPEEGRYVQGNQSLQIFIHPESAIYLFGGSHVNLAAETDLGERVPDAVVYVPTLGGEMFAHVCAAVVLWDRYTKRGGRFG